MMLRLLISVEWKQWRNHISQGGSKNIFSLIVIGMASVLVLAILIPLSISLGHHYAFKQISPFVSLFFLIATGFILLFGIPRGFKDLFSSTDLAMMFTLPIPPKSIFWVKYFKNFLGSAGILWLIMFMPLTLFGFSSGCGWLYYPTVFLTTAGVSVIAVSLAFIFNLGLIQIIPAKRGNELMTAMSMLAGVLIYFLIQMPNLMIQSHHFDLSQTKLILPRWVPTNLAASALKGASANQLSSFLPAIIIILTAGILLFLCSILVEKGFRRGWIRMNVGKGNRKKNLLPRKTPQLRNPVLFIGIKELRTIQRDAREWMVLVPSLVISGFPIMNIFFQQHNHIAKDPLLGWLIIQCGMLFFFCLLSAQLTLLSVGREGKSAWILRVLPLKGWQIALGKLWSGWIIPFVIYFVVEVVIGVILNWHWALLLLGIAMYAVLSLGMNGIGLWIGTKSAKYNPNNPQDRVAGGSRLLLGLLDLLYLITAALPGSAILLPIAKVTGSIWLALLGGVGMIVLSFSVAAITLYYASWKFDQGVQIEIVSGRRNRL